MQWLGLQFKDRRVQGLRSWITQHGKPWSEGAGLAMRRKTLRLGALQYHTSEEIGDRLRAWEHSQELQHLVLLLAAPSITLCPPATARLSVLWQYVLGRGVGPVSQVCLSVAAAAAANCAQEGIGKKPLAPQWGGDRDGWGGSCVPEPSGEKDQSCTDGSSARQAPHRHLVSITQHLAARKIIPHPNGTIRYG